MSKLTETQETLLDAIQTHVSAVQNANLFPGDKANALRTLALAYRLAAGGPQPGGSVVGS